MWMGLERDTDTNSPTRLWRLLRGIAGISTFGARALWIMGCRRPITRANNCAERVKPRPALNSALRAGGERI